MQQAARAEPIDGRNRPRRLHSYFHAGTFPFWSIHLAAVGGVALCGFSLRGVGLAVGAYFVRMVLVTAAYHRYFSHRAFKTSRPFQLLLALGAQSAGQKGVLWWAAHHRRHHRHSDAPADPHSVRQEGFWHAHVGWILLRQYGPTNPRMIGDLLKFPELRFLNRAGVRHLPAVALATAFLAAAGVHGLVWGFLVSTVLLWHGTFAINSLAHVAGRRRFATGDDSRNSLALAILTTGEGWHNNHHRYPSSARQGFRWWEIDATLYVLLLLEKLGLIWELRRPPRALACG